LSLKDWVRDIKDKFAKCLEARFPVAEGAEMAMGVVIHGWGDTFNDTSFGISWFGK